MIDAHLEDEVIERLLVNALQGVLQFQCKLYQYGEVGPAFCDGRVIPEVPLQVYATGRHVGGANGFDFDNVLELRQLQQLKTKF